MMYNLNMQTDKMPFLKTFH